MPFTINLSPEALLIAFVIFVLRVFNNMLATIRIVVINRDRRGLAFIIGFIESVIFALTIGAVVSNLSELQNLFVYALGFPVGGYLGQVLEARFVKGFMVVNVVTSSGGHDMAVHLREQGFGVTETQSEGASGHVMLLRSVVSRQDLRKLIDAVHRDNPDAFITTEEARAVQRGWLQAGRKEK